MLMMQPMIDFTVAMLTALANFLGTEPVIYLFALCLLCFVAKLIKIFLP